MLDIKVKTIVQFSKYTDHIQACYEIVSFWRSVFLFNFDQYPTLNKIIIIDFINMPIVKRVLEP